MNHIFCDFDGVINAIHPCAANSTPMDLYAVDKNAIVGTTDFGNIRIKWSSELVAEITELIKQDNVVFHWLSTWQPDTKTLDNVFGWQGLTDTCIFYDTKTKQGLWTGKFNTVLNFAIDNPNETITWIDDDECTCRAQQHLEHGLRNVDNYNILMIQPNYADGINKKQMQKIKRFAEHSADNTLSINKCISYDTASIYAN